MDNNNNIKIYTLDNNINYNNYDNNQDNFRKKRF